MLLGRIADFVRAGFWPSAVQPATQLGVTVAGNASQSGATAVTGALVTVTTSTTTNNSLRLPVPSTIGDSVFIRNADASDVVNVYPATGGTINALTADAAFSLAANRNALFVAIGANAWAVVLTA